MDSWEYYDREGREEDYQRRYRPEPHVRPLSARAVRDFEDASTQEGTSDE